MTSDSTFTRLVNPDLRTAELYIPGLTTAEAAARYNVAPEDIIKLSSNENPLGPPPLAVEAAQRTLSDLHRYPDSKAHALRAAIAEKEGLKKDNVMFGAGSSEIMSFIIRAFSRVGDEIVAMDPSFTVYNELASADQRVMVTMPLGYPFELTMTDVEQAVTDRTRVIFMTRPNNPTSRFIPLEMVEQVAKMLPNAIVVSDEAYVEFAVDYRKHTAANLVNKCDNVIVTRTFSKAYGIPNLRVGYALGPADAVQYLFRVKPKWNVGDVAQNAAIGALQDTEHLQKTLEAVHEGRAYLIEQFNVHPKLDVLPDQQGNFIMMRIEGYEAADFTDTLAAEGIIIRGDFHPDFVRISIGTMDENRKLVDVVNRTLAQVEV